ncbi:MAG: PilZ domain-containing protein [Tepidisphaeraceae bacterium]
MVAMMSNPSMSITGNGAERRIFPRKEVSVRIEGKRLDHSIDARQQPQLSLMLRDVSLGGLAAMTAAPLGRGERLTVFFPPEGAARGWDAYGRVIRCDPSPAGGYRLAVAFDPLPAA